MDEKFIFCSTVWWCMCENSESASVFLLLTLHYADMHSLETRHPASIHTFSTSLWLGCVQTLHIGSGADPPPGPLLDLLTSSSWDPPYVHSSFRLCQQARCQRARSLLDDVLLQPELDCQHQPVWISLPSESCIVNKPPTCVPYHDDIAWKSTYFI